MDPRPRLRPDLQASPIHDSGGEKNIVLKDPVSEKYFRLSAWEYELLSALDGAVTLDEAVTRLRAGGQYYTEDDAKIIVS